MRFTCGDLPSCKGVQVGWAPYCRAQVSLYPSIFLGKFWRKGYVPGLTPSFPLNIMHKSQDTKPKNIDQAAAHLLKRVEELISLKKYDDSERFLYEIIKYKPDYSDAYFQMGNVFSATNQFTKAEEFFKKAIELEPDFFEALNNLAALYFNSQKNYDAIPYYKKALEIRSDADFTLYDLATCLSSRGHLDEAMPYYRRAIKVSSQKAEIYSDMLLAMVYAPSVSPEHLAEEALNFGKKLADPVTRLTSFSHVRDPERRLKIGYVSSDIRYHSVHYFFEPLLNECNRKQFDVFVYSNTQKEDHVTARLRAKCDYWRDIRDLTDDEAAQLIETDKIDILIDITSHTGHNRLMVFARKPAPVQVTWLAYPGTTGMKAMDYRITDALADPPGMTEHLNAETLWRLPDIFCCYQAHESNPPVIDHPPFEDNGYVTFGCFNNFVKVGDTVLSAWAGILEKVSDARLFLEIAGLEEEKFHNAIWDRLKKYGLPIDRVILEPRKKANQFVLYNKIDIALDPFPCVGGTTSMDTLWMGVPFVTLAGKSFASRMGVTILKNAGLPELVTDTVPQYIALAIDLANDKARLKKLRHNLRDRITASPLMDQKSFVRNMEAAYREMWRRFCENA